MSPTIVYSLAVLSNLFFSTASLGFSHFARKFSPVWINMFKVSVAMACFLVALGFEGVVPIGTAAVGCLLASGLMGLCIGDIFLFKAYATLGPGRALVLYSFQPLLLGFYGSMFLGQDITPHQMGAVFCMMVCLAFFVVERRRAQGHWDWKSFLWAFAGILLDGTGVMLTRTAYEFTPEMGSMQVNVIRSAGALLGFLLIRPRGYPQILKDFAAMPGRERALVTLSAVCGTFISLSLYLAAVKHAHMASLTAISITGPVWVSLLECVWSRRLPNAYLLSAFAFFLLGFYLMT